MTTPDLTVIMAAYDTEQYVGEAVASVLERADRLRELIVVDDGSTDGTPGVLGAFDDERLRVVTQENRGPSAARNVAIGLARTPFVGFLDSDDLWVAARPDPRLAALEADPGLSGSFGYCRFFVPADDGTPQIVLERMTASEMGSLIVRREVLEEAGGFDEAFVIAEDMDLVSRMREAGRRFETLDELVFLDRLRPGSLTRDRDAVLRGWMQAGRAAMKRQRERQAEQG